MYSYIFKLLVTILCMFHLVFIKLFYDAIVISVQHILYPIRFIPFLLSVYNYFYFLLLPICLLYNSLLFFIYYLFSNRKILRNIRYLVRPNMYARSLYSCVFWRFACRLRGKKSRGHGYSGDDLLTSVDVKSAAHQSVVFEWRHWQAALTSPMLYLCSDLDRRL